MTNVDFHPLTRSEIRAIENEAQRLRAAAMANGIRAAFAWLVALPKKATSCPSCARPLHP